MDKFTRSEPSQTDTLWKDKWEKILFDTGLCFDLSNTDKQFSLLHPDHDNGNEWWPGYYEKWFTSGIGYKEHTTFVGHNEHLGPIAISLMNFKGQHQQLTQSKNEIKALVRTDLGFHVINVNIQTTGQFLSPHQRGSSISTALKKFKGAINNSANEISYTSPVILERILREYCDKLRQIHIPDNPINLSKDSGLSDMKEGASSEDLIRAAENVRQHQMWGTAKSIDFFKAINTTEIAASLEQAPFPTICKKLHDLEKQNRSIRYLVDVVRMENSGDAQQWSDLLSQLGNEEMGSVSVETKSSKPDANKPGDIPKRQACIQDFMEKERAYVKNLQILETHLLQPLTSSSSVLKKRDQSLLFKLKEIIQVNSHLNKKLEEAIKTDSIGEALLPFASQMKVYASYVKSHEEKSLNFKNLIKENPKFKEFVEKCRAQYLSNKLSFEDLLISPVQKVPRYCLVFKDLIKFTPGNHPDLQNLIDCSVEYARMASYLNEGIDKEKSLLAVLELLHSLENCPPDLAKSHRFLVNKYDLMEIDPENPGKEEKALTLHLLNDCIVLSRPRKSGIGKSSKSLHMSKFVALYELSRLDVLHWKDRGLENVFQIDALLSQEQKSRLIKLGEVSIGDPNHMHVRTPSLHSTSNTSNYTFKTDLHSQHSVHIFKSSQTAEIVRQIRDWKYKHTQQNASLRYFRMEINCNTDICFNVYEDYKEYLDSSTKSPILLMSCDETNVKSVTFERDSAVKIVYLQRLGKKAGFILRSEELPFPDSYCSGTISDTQDEQEENFVELVVNLGRIVDTAYNTQKNAETCQYLLSKLLHSHMPKSPMKASASTQSLSPFKTLGRMKQPNRSRRSSITSMFDEHAAALTSGTPPTTSELALASAPSINMFSGGSSDLPISNEGLTSSTGSIKVSKIKRRQSLSAMMWTKIASKMNPKSKAYVLDLFCSYLEDTCLDLPELYNQHDNHHKVKDLLNHVKPGKLTTAIFMKYESYTVSSSFLEWVKLNRDSIWSYSKKLPADKDISERDGCTVRLLRHLKSFLESQPNAELSQWAELLLKDYEDDEDPLGQVDTLLALIKDPKSRANSLGLTQDGAISKSAILQDQKRSADVTPSRRSSAPPVSFKNVGVSLSSIDEKANNSHALTDADLSRASSVSSKSELHSRKSTGNLKLIPRKPVKYKSIDDLSLESVDLGESASNNKEIGKDAVFSSLPNMPKSVLLRNNSNNEVGGRRAVSLPVGFGKLVENSQKNLSIEYDRMSSEIENLKNQLKCMKKALEDEIRKKSVMTSHPSSTSKEEVPDSGHVSWESVDKSIHQLDSISNSQSKVAQETIDLLKEENGNLTNLYHEAQLELSQLKDRLHQLEQEKQEWKQKGEMYMKQLENCASQNEFV